MGHYIAIATLLLLMHMSLDITNSLTVLYQYVSYYIKTINLNFLHPADLCP